jgi:hypothetical protein
MWHGDDTLECKQLCPLQLLMLVCCRMELIGPRIDYVGEFNMSHQYIPGWFRSKVSAFDVTSYLIEIGEPFILATTQQAYLSCFLQRLNPKSPTPANLLHRFLKYSLSSPSQLCVCLQKFVLQGARHLFCLSCHLILRLLGQTFCPIRKVGNCANRLCDSERTLCE